MEGLGVMIKKLNCNKKSVTAIQKGLNQTIKKVWLDEDTNPERLRFEFENGYKMSILDNKKGCCEYRYMSTDYDLSLYSGAKLLDLELKDGGEYQDGSDEHDIMFLDVITDKGVFVICTHNIHNGYYGGFAIEAQED